MRKVLIGTPSFDGKIDVHYVNSLVRTLASAPKDIAVDFLFIAQDALIQRARNDIVASAVKNEIDDLVFIDSDQAWDPAWFYGLLAHPVDVVGFPVVKKNDIEQYNIKCVTRPPEVKENGLMRVDGVGTGFLRLTKKALALLWEKSPKYTENGFDKCMAFNVTVENGELIGEDISFCKTLEPLGIYVDARVTIPHIGTKVYVGKFDSWLAGVMSNMKKKEEKANG